MDRPAPRVVIGAGSIERAAATARPATLFAHRLAAFMEANAVFMNTVGAVGGASDDVAGVLCEQAGDAYRDLVATPAPDFQGLAEKVAAMATWNDGVRPKQEAAEALYADARALLNGEPEA